MATKVNDKELLQLIKDRLNEDSHSQKVIEQLNNELKEINSKLEASESMKSHFISHIANELVNPFASVLGLSKAILAVDRENWKKVISMVALIHTEVFNLDFQFKNIFMAAKLEAGEESPTPVNVDMHKLIDSVIDSYKIECKKKKISIKHTFTGDHNFKTDPDKMKLVISNLMSNAIKFSFEEGVVEVTAQHEQNQLSISVRDYGIGLSEKNRETIFDRFNRVDSGINSNNRGHGLGLSVNKAIVDMLSGSMAVESELGQGSCFTITVPEIEVPEFGYSPNADETFFDMDENAEIF